MGVIKLLAAPIRSIVRFPYFSGLTAFLYQRMRDYCIGMISSRWAANGANVCGL